MAVPTSVFRAYDIRGIKETEINHEFAQLLGRSLVAHFKSEAVVIGYDARPTSIEFSKYLSEGIQEQGAKVYNIGMVPTELVPITAGLKQVREAVIITASHNPPNYVGFKLLTDHGSQGILPQNGRNEIQALMESPDTIPASSTRGEEIKHDPWPAYIDHLFSIVPKSSFTKPLNLLAEAGNGMGGVMVHHLLRDLPIKVTPLLFEPDGTYPVHTPNPHLPEARKLAVSEAKKASYDLTVMFDGDADRAAFLDENAEFVPADYFGTLIMDKIIHPKHPDSPVVIDYRRGIVTEWAGKKNGYAVFRAKAGYPNMKRAIADHHAEFGFEASAHVMYRDTFIAESSGLTLMYILKILSESDQTMSQLIAPYREQAVMLDELNYEHDNPDELLAILKEKFNDAEITEPDGLSIRYPEWHATVRKSGTEPLVRLNLEAHGQDMLDQAFSKINQTITQSGGHAVAH
jgi:phosphomannomutase